jgi:hypothetical protein
MSKTLMSVVFHCSHDWPDKECVQILQNVRKAMKPGSKVLVREYLPLFSLFSGAQLAYPNMLTSQMSTSSSISIV